VSSFIIIYSSPMINYRLEIQAQVRQLGRNPSTMGQQSVVTARDQLTVLQLELKNAMHVAGVVEINVSLDVGNESLEMWDDVAYELVPGGPNRVPDDAEPVSLAPTEKGLEDHVIPFPSNGNIGPAYSQLEVTHRISHCDHHISRLRDLIAEKSFQYSHIIRVSPRKAVNTRSRAEVKKLNLQISIHCRLYTQCRARLIRLGAEPEILNRLLPLSYEDVKASSAMINPNEPGSTQLKLSWIWQTAGGHRWGLAGTSGSRSVAGNATSNISECKFM